MHSEEAEFLAALGPERGTSPRALASVRIVMKATSSLHNEVTSRAGTAPGTSESTGRPAEGWRRACPRAWGRDCSAEGITLTFNRALAVIDARWALEL